MRLCLCKNLFFGKLAAPLVAVGIVGVAQGDPTSAVNSQISSDQATFQKEQQALIQSLSVLIAKRATPAQMQAWQQQNASRLAAQQQRAINLGEDAALQPLTLLPTPNIPTNASQVLKDFLTTQVALANARAQIHNQLLSALPNQVTEDQLKQMRQSEDQAFTQQQGATLKLQTQRIQTLAAQSTQQPLPLPPAPIIPSGVNSQMAALITAKNQLMREEVQVWNQNLSATPAAREAAMQQWHEQNKTRFQQLQQMAANLSSPSSNQ